MCNPISDWDTSHKDRKEHGIEKNHKPGRHVESASLKLQDRPDLKGRFRPELHLYTFDEEVKGKDVPKKRFRARLHSADRSALVIRIGSTRVGDVVKETVDNGFRILESGEILLTPSDVSTENTDEEPAIRLEFTVDNPGGTLGDYNC